MPAPCIDPRIVRTGPHVPCGFFRDSHAMGDRGMTALMIILAIAAATSRQRARRAG
jgi:hypothetical protein